MANLETAVKAFRQAQAGVPAAEAKAKELVRNARAAVDRARTVLAAAIVAEAVAGTAQVDLIRRTGYSRERIRQILRRGGVEAD